MPAAADPDRPGGGLGELDGQAVGVALAVAVRGEGTGAVIVGPGAGGGPVTRGERGAGHVALHAIVGVDAVDIGAVGGLVAVLRPVHANLGVHGERGDGRRDQQRVRGRIQRGDQVVRAAEDRGVVNGGAGVAGDLHRGRVAGGVRVLRAGDVLGLDGHPPGDAPVVVAGALGIHGVGHARVADAGVLCLVAVVVGRVPPEVENGLAAGEQRVHVVLAVAVAIGDDGLRVGAQERGRVVVHALAGHREVGLRAALAVAARIAEMEQEDHGVGGRGELADAGLAVVLDLVVAQAAVAVDVRVEPEAVLGRVVGVEGVGAGPAVAVAQVDHDARAVDGLLDPGPRGAGAVDLDDVARVLAGDIVEAVRVAAVARGGVVRGAHDDRDLGIGADRGVGRLRAGRHDDADAGEEGRDEDQGCGSHDLVIAPADVVACLPSYCARACDAVQCRDGPGEG